jgi:hypothetical protein
MATNLSDTTSYATQIELSGFNAGGEMEVYTMKESNCSEGGAGPAVTKQQVRGSTIKYTFKPFTVTCLVVKKAVPKQ